MSNPNNIGHWKSVEDGMPGNRINCLVWSAHYGKAILAYHDSEIREKRSGKWDKSGWITLAGQVVPGVTHYCDDICAPGEHHFPDAAKMVGESN